MAVDGIKGEAAGVMVGAAACRAEGAPACATDREEAMGGDAICAKVDDAMARVFSLLGKRWSGLVIAVLMERSVHFAELRRAIPGISERMLSDRLAELCAVGLVVREVAEGPPLRVSYRLSEAGAALGPALGELGRWAETYLPEGEGGRCPEQFRK